MNECSFYKVKYLTDTLKKEYDDISRIFPEVVISDRSKFAEIQTQWIAIISEECHLYARNEGGSLHPLEENGCRATLLKEKILFLRSLR